MFFGDVGTSRLYVLGLAVFYAGLAAPYFVAGICALVVAVGWAYTHVCRVNPDGGGVYSSGRLLHPMLGVVGALLLFANYIITAAISTYEAVIYIGLPIGMPRQLAPYISVFAIALLGALNYVGSRRAAQFALVVAVGAVLATALLASLTITHLPEGWANTATPTGGIWNNWVTLVAVVLALSGVESIANMTGIMVEPVARTAKKAIWPVVLEVALLNILLIFVVVSIPRLGDLGENGIIADKPPAERTELENNVKDKVLYVVAEEYVNRPVAIAVSMVFGLLLLSATNTAIVAMISIQFAMSRDRELPVSFSRLNFYGVPRLGLLVALALPAVTCLLAKNVETLAELYAIGVVGAIAINLASCAYNRKLDLKRLIRGAMWALAVIMLAIWLTIAFTKPHATIFLGAVLAGGMTMRFVARRSLDLTPRPSREPAPRDSRGEADLQEALAPLLPFDPDRGRILVATRANQKLLKFAFDEATTRNANLFVLFVRDVAILFPGRERTLTPEEDGEAYSLFRAAREMSRERGVPVQTIYCVSNDPADVILDFSATYAVDLVLLGVSRNAGVLRALRGDVITGVASNLPKQSTLLIHA